ncbi:MAG: crossover junction endodeoxyribonuclease RuvC [Spirochaetaceae bacterium]|nr:crossover junction endodeoxyribonuclease RuvC [Spirochaetaceae bacterium]
MGSCKILGIDPGLASTGWGVIEAAGNRVRHVEHGTIETGAEMPHSKRLAAIYDGVRAVIEKHKPDEAAIETLYFARNVTSALTVSEARGVVLLALEQAGLPVFEARPDDIKKAVVGIGRAEKAQVQEMVKILLALDELPKPDHAADALGAAICAANNRGERAYKMGVFDKG